MSTMMKQITNLAQYSGLGVLVLSLFFVVFAGVLFWVFRKNSKQIYDRIQNLPFDDERKTV
jgi:cbb3-type cytochrome oxidase subunit 3